jgi:20S proteasome alpha/beta subunit
LAFVDLLGTTYSASTLATGYGAHIAQPLLRKAVEGREDTLSETEARKIIEDSMRVLFYRDARSIDKVPMNVVYRRDRNLAYTFLSTKLQQLQIKGSRFQTRHILKHLGSSQKVSEDMVHRRSDRKVYHT